MRNWVGLAQASGLELTVSQLERMTAPLTAIEEKLRPLMHSLTADMEPDTELNLEREGE